VRELLRTPYLELGRPLAGSEGLDERGQTGPPTVGPDSTAPRPSRCVNE
jgi:hypothetical protein